MPQYFRLAVYKHAIENGEGAIEEDTHGNWNGLNLSWSFRQGSPFPLYEFPLRLSLLVCVSLFPSPAFIWSGHQQSFPRPCSLFPVPLSFSVVPFPCVVWPLSLCRSFQPNGERTSRKKAYGFPLKRGSPPPPPTTHSSASSCIANFGTKPFSLALCRFFVSRSF